MIDKYASAKLYKIIKYNKDNQKIDNASGNFCVEILRRERESINEYLTGINKGLNKENMKIITDAWNELLDDAVEKCVDEEYTRILQP